MRYALTLLAILVLKLMLLAVFGPISMPDTTGYMAYSDEILADSAWLGDAGLDRAPAPTTAIHMLGYPALIAALRACVGQSWSWALVALQMLLSLTAIAGLCALRRPLGLSHGAILFTLVATATTSSLVHDATLLTDSLNASLLDLAITLMMLAALSGRSARASVAFGIGMLIAVAFLLRDVMCYLWLPMLPLLACAAAFPSIAIDRRRAKSPGFVVATLILVPLFATYAAYNEWNRQRTGTAFVTTIGQLTLLIPVAAAATRDPEVFSDDAPLDQVARQGLGDYDYDDVLELNRRLFVTWHQTAPEIAAAAYRKYFASWRQHPAAMTHAALTNLRENQLLLLFRPIDALREYILWATGEPSELGRWKSVEANPWVLPIYLLDRLCKAIAAIIFASFLFLTPWRAWRERRMSAEAPIGLALWLLYLGWYAIYASVHIETRYMAPLLPYAILLGVTNIAWLRHRRWAGAWRVTRVSALSAARGLSDKS
jgi:hypothetical protein